MTLNESLILSAQIKDLLLHVFYDDVPIGQIEKQARNFNTDGRDRIFTPCNVILTMLLTATQEDNSLQNGLNIFKSVFEDNSRKVLQAESEQLHREKISDSLSKKTSGRPKKYLSRLPKSYQKPLCENTAGYSTARKRLDSRLVQQVYEHSCDFGELDKESWYGMKTYIGDGTYLQLQDTDDIRKEYVVKGQESSYPQALLQALIRQGSGQISQFFLSSRHQSELSLIIPMIKKLEKNSLGLSKNKCYICE